MERTIQKQEALARMKTLDFHPNVINEFEREDLINLSESIGILYWLDDEQKELVKKFEEKHNAVVYHAIYTNTAFGRMLALLYVSEYEEEWEMDRDDLKEGYPIAYVINLDDEHSSEFGSIGIKSQFGGLIRTA